MARLPGLRARHGLSLAEIVVSMTLASMVVLALTTAAIQHLRIGSHVVAQFEALDAMAVASAILTTETNDTRPDDVLVTADSLALRAFRGTALVCDTVDSYVHLRYRGSRAPEPNKDSVLVLRHGTEQAFTFRTPTRLATLGCAPVETADAYSMRIDGDVRPADVLLFFQRGSYHLTDGALRWRSGAGGRQPLTAEVFERTSRFVPGTPDVAVLHIDPMTGASSTALSFRRAPW